MSAAAMHARGRRNRAERAEGVLVSRHHVAVRDGLIGHGRMPDIQRARIVGAMVEVVREHGGAQATVSHVVARSGVSRRTFYETFTDRDACFVAAFDLAIERGAARVVPAFAQAGERQANRGVGTGSDGASRWREKVRAGLASLLDFLQGEPELGGLCIVDALGACPRLQRRRTEIVAVLVHAVDVGRKHAGAGLVPTLLTAETVVGGVLSVLHARLAERDPKPMSRLLSPLMAMIVLPYLGPDAAAEEKARPAPRLRQPPERLPSNPLAGLEMRLTYRTTRVLVAIAELGEQRLGPSNRQVADAAGVHDQGQISKLLIRLERLGLAENAGRVRGEPNAWRLTPRGSEIERVIREQATSAGSRR
jgi:AcrR family transcriptional regulator